jgi:GxxExxY protein
MFIFFMDSLLYQELTGRIIRCAMQVHNYFGSGFPEIVYQKALLIELKKQKMAVESQALKDIYYRDIFIGKRKFDVMVENKVLLELKALPFMDTKWNMQILNYLKVFEIDVGLLLNFGGASLQFKRFINPKFFKLV